MADEGSFWEQVSSDEGGGFRVDAGKVRKVELSQEPSGHERVRVTVESVKGRIRVFEAPKSLLGSVLELLYEVESETLRRRSARPRE